MKKIKRHSFKNLVNTMHHLRSKKGCAWDKIQTHESLIPSLEEESLEVIHAIKQQDYPSLQEELGDLLHQILFHAQIADEKGKFNIYDIINSLVEKLKRRHPHVFGGKKTDSIPEILKNWEKIKKQEKKS